MDKIFSAKSLDDVKEQAYRFFAEFGVAQYDIDFSIIEQPVKRLFGTKGDYRVRARAEVPEKTAQPEQTEQTAPSQKTAAQSSQSAQAQPAAAAPRESGKPAFAASDNRRSGRGHNARGQRNAQTRQQDRRSAVAASTEKNQADAAAALDSVKPQPVISAEKFEPAVSYLTGVLGALGMRGFAVKVVQGGNSPVLDIVGDKLGTAIGRRGETLDALQYLTILAMGRGEAHSDRYRRLTVDCNGYRAKRRESLESLAERTARKVIASGRRVALEPMNPYERRIIHSKVSEIAGVNSSSIGEDPYRKVVISFGNSGAAEKPGADASDSKNRTDRPDRFERSASRDRDRNNDRGHARRRDRDNRDSRENRDNRDNRRDSRDGRSRGGESAGQFGGDVFATSFERDYKRNNSRRDTGSKESEHIQISAETTELEKNALLYGKIEL
jgi:spoIIIJ-associated protein